MRKILPNGKVSGRFIPSFPQQPWQSFNYKQLRLNRAPVVTPSVVLIAVSPGHLGTPLVSFTHLQVTHKKTVGNFLSKDFHAKLQILKKLKKWVSCGCILSHVWYCLIICLDTSQKLSEKIRQKHISISPFLVSHCLGCFGDSPYWTIVRSVEASPARQLQTIDRLALQEG